ncbi:MAG: zinc finger Ran-binding domain-containing protein, partial [archaeon]|nr:zinc finger Ran-binding domain-containing protein [archaeon]
GTRDIFDRPGDHTDVASRANEAHRRTPIPDWECSACTYHNVSGEAQCSICGTEAPAFGFEEQAETSQVDRLLGWASECFRPQTLRITFLPRVQALAGPRGLQKELRKRTQNFISIIKTCADTGILARRQQQVMHWKSFQLEDSFSETISSSSYLSQTPPVVAPSSDAIEIKLSREIELLEDLDHLAESLSAVLNQGRSSLVHSTEGSLEPSIRDKSMRLSQ